MPETCSAVRLAARCSLCMNFTCDSNSYWAGSKKRIVVVLGKGVPMIDLSGSQKQEPLCRRPISSARWEEARHGLGYEPGRSTAEDQGQGDRSLKGMIAEVEGRPR